LPVPVPTMKSSVALPVRAGPGAVGDGASDRRDTIGWLVAGSMWLISSQVRPWSWCGKSRSLAE
jgi:hypothetical protein